MRNWAVLTHELSSIQISAKARNIKKCLGFDMTKKNADYKKQMKVSIS